MPISTKLRNYLDDNNVKYITITHSKAYTAQEIAAAIHCPGKELAKSIMVKVNDQFVMIVLSASEKIDFDLLKKLFNQETVELATESEFKSLFPECEIGAMPVFGNIYGVDVYATENIAKDEEIFFNAGSHTIAIKLDTKYFLELVQPQIVKVALTREKIIG